MINGLTMFIRPKLQRSALAKFRCGVAPLRIETGRYERLDKTWMIEYVRYVTLALKLRSMCSLHALFIMILGRNCLP